MLTNVVVDPVATARHRAKAPRHRENEVRQFAKAAQDGANATRRAANVARDRESSARPAASAARDLENALNKSANTILACGPKRLIVGCGARPLPQAVLTLETPA